jgi:hypothetical protein
MRLLRVCLAIILITPVLCGCANQVASTKEAVASTESHPLELPPATNTSTPTRLLPPIRTSLPVPATLATRKSAPPTLAGGNTLTTSKNARLGIEHAIWAGLVSGALDGRAPYWEDGFAVFFPELSWTFLHMPDFTDAIAFKMAALR